MNRFLVAIAVGLASALVALGTAFAHGPGPMRAPTGRVVTVKAGASANLTIVHIVKGCHNWTNGKVIAEKAAVTLNKGGRLVILNQDVDVHKVVQLAGPRIKTGMRMMMNAKVTLRFAQAGTYRFKTVTSEMPGMPEMKTIEPDYQLLLTVRVK